MSGTPTEAEVQTQWRNLIALIESTRNFVDGTVVGGGNLLDLLLQSLEGEYMPAATTGWVQRFRAGLASLISSERVAESMQAVLFEYGRLVDKGGGATTIPALMRALYEHFVGNNFTVKSRGITFDTTPTTGVGNVGNGAMARLTVDENGFPLEACHIETKLFRCRQDRNTGVLEHAEVFEFQGEQRSPDGLGRYAWGSGALNNRAIRSLHAGTTDGGSKLRNSSWSTYSSTATPKFEGWAEVAGGAHIQQDTVNVYRSSPNSTVDASLRINGGSGTVTLKQTNLRDNKLDPDTPYFFRVMLNKTVGTAVGGTVTIRMGSVSASISIASLGSGWQELLIPIGTDCWFRNFNEAPFDIEVEWSSSTSGYLLVDDALFAPWTLIDGTYWVLRQNAASPVAWLVDDTLEFTDTGGDPSTGKIQWWLWVAGLGYLPSTTGTPTFTDPA